MKSVYTMIIITLISIGLLVPITSSAAPVLITDRTTFAGTDFFNWGVLGPNGTVVADPFNINSNSGTVTATVSNPTGQFERRDQGIGWGGNFAPGDALLWTQDTVGPMVIEFNNPVGGAGAQFQADNYGTFTARIDVYDASNTLIGSFTRIGNSTGNGDNSAIFVGVKDTASTIKRIEYSINNLAGDFAINQLDLSGAPTTVVPTMTEWGMIIFMMLAGLGSIYYMRRKIKGTS